MLRWLDTEHKKRPSWRQTHRAHQGQEEQHRTEAEVATEPWGRGPERWRRPCTCRRGSRGALKRRGAQEP